MEDTSEYNTGPTPSIAGIKDTFDESFDDGLLPTNQLDLKREEDQQIVDKDVVALEPQKELEEEKQQEDEQNDLPLANLNGMPPMEFGPNQQEQLERLMQQMQMHQNNDEEEENYDSDYDSSDDDAEPVDPKFGCKHYKRRCQKRCPECLEFFACRLCHDKVKFETELDPKKNHQLDRHAVKEIRCNECLHIQAPAQSCEKCGIEFAGYFCKVCNLFDDNYEEKQIFHCDGCGICRVGGKENFFHCDTCQCCQPLEMKDSHVCIPEVTRQDCVVCQCDMHSSRQGTIFLRCGHAMHPKCFKGYSKENVNCPVCKKSMIDPENFEAQIDEQIANMPMPDEFKDQKMLMLCNDCQELSEVPFHILGGKCDECRSYNTTRVDAECDKLKFEKKKSQKEEQKLAQQALQNKDNAQ